MNTPAPCSIDTAALDALRQERVDWRFRSAAPALTGLTLGEAADRRLNLFTDGFFAPFVVLDDEALEHNLRTMAAWCAARGVVLAPHGKTTMAPQLFARQIEHGAWGITCANAGHLRIYRAFGVSRILLANQLLDPSGLRWLAAELAADPSFEFICWVDSVRGVELMTEALEGSARPVDVLLELGADGGRTGVRDTATALAVAEAVHASPALRLRGTGGYEGALSHDTDDAALAKISSYVDGLRELAITFADKRLLDGQIIVTMRRQRLLRPGRERAHQAVVEPVSTCSRCCAAAPTSPTTTASTARSPRSASTRASTASRRSGPRCTPGRR